MRSSSDEYAPDHLVAERDRLILRTRALLRTANDDSRALSEPEYGELERAEARLELIDRQIAAYERDSARSRATVPESQGRHVTLFDGADADRATVVRFDGRAATRESRHDEGFVGEIRGLLASSFADGGALVPDTVSAQVWAALTVSTPLLAAGVTVVPLDGPSLTLPGVADVPVVGWLGEGREIDDAGLKFRAARLIAKKVAGLAKISNELKGYLPALQILERELRRALATAIDRALTRGPGSEYEPLGVFKDDRIPTTDLADPTSVVVTDLDWLVDAVTAVRTRGATPTAVVLSPGLWGRLQKIKVESESVKSLLQPDVTAPAGARLYGLQVVVSPAIPSNLVHGSASDVTEVLVGEMAQVVVGQGPIRVEQSESYGFRTDETGVRAVAHVDGITMLHDAFQRIRGLRVGDQ